MALFWWLIIAAVYLFLACAIFVVQVQNFPVTPGLAALRGAVWPVYLLTGWPSGEPLPMD